MITDASVLPISEVQKADILELLLVGTPVARYSNQVAYKGSLIWINS